MTEVFAFFVFSNIFFFLEIKGDFQEKRMFCSHIVYNSHDFLIFP